MYFESLSSLSFTCGSELCSYLKELSARNGFGIYLKDSKNANRLRFYCSNHQLHLNVKNTRKTGCGFRLVFNKNSNGIYVISKYSNFEHSHQISNQMCTVDQPIQQEIATMKKIGICNFHIICYIEKKFGISITREDIQKFSSKNEKINYSETKMLSQYMNDKGKCFIFEDQNGSIAGLYTVTYEEEKDLRKYCDFLVIDGTSIPNFIDWTIIPISLQGNKMELISGGVAFAPSENQEFYVWLLSIILSIAPNFRCIISDEDNGICAAMDEYPNICHILCLKHKIAIVQNLIGKNHPNREKFLELINVMFYSRSIIQSNEAVNEIYKEFPEVIHYFENNIFPNRCKLLVSMRPNVFHFGHLPSQLGESYNNMIKRDLNNSLKHLYEIRDHISRKFFQKKQYEEQVQRSSFVFHHYIINEYGLNISRKICSIIDIEVNNSERIEIEQVGENEYVARDNSNLKFNLNFLDCECHYPAHAGIPCRHIIALFRKTGNAFPIHLINSRFIENKNTEKTGEILEDNESLNVTKISEYEELHEIPQISHNNEWMDLLLTEEEDSEFLFEEEEEDREIFNDSNELIDGFVDDEFGFPLRGNYDTIQTVPRRNSISLYQRLMSISRNFSNWI